MSLEQSLERLAVATEKLVAVQEQIFAAVTAARPAAAAPAAESSAPRPGRKAAPAATSASAPSSPSPVPAAASGSPSTPTPVPAAAADGAAPSNIRYETVREAVLKLAETKGHQVAVTVLGGFGVKNGKELKPTQWADALKKIEEAAGVSIAQLIGAPQPIA